MMHCNLMPPDLVREPNEIQREMLYLMTAMAPSPEQARIAADHERRKRKIETMTVDELLGKRTALERIAAASRGMSVSAYREKRAENVRAGKLETLEREFGELLG